MGDRLKGALKRSGLSWLWLSAPLFGGLYAAQGITGSMVQTALPTALRDAGMALDRVGLLYLLYLPWAIKFLWAPLVDRFSIYRLGRRRAWLLACQTGLVLCFVAVAFVPPAVSLPMLMVLLLAVATLAATQDIATDALAVEATPADRRGFISGAGVGGSYLGFLIGIGLWLPVYASFGWQAAMLVMAICLLVATVPALFARRIDQTEPAHDGSGAKRASVLSGLGRRTLRNGLIFLLIYQAGLRLGIALLGPFLVDAGLSLSEIGWLKGTGGAIIGALAALAGGLIARRLGPKWSLAGCALLQAVLFGLLALAAASGNVGGQVLALLILAQAAATALSFVALYTSMMGWCNSAQTGTDFALLQSADAIGAIVLAAVAGFISEYLGHAFNFAAASALLLFAAAASLAVTRFAAEQTQVIEPAARQNTSALHLGEQEQ